MSGIQVFPDKKPGNASPTSYVGVKGAAWDLVNAAFPFSGTLTGALSADTWKSIISVTGAGILNWAAIRTTSTAVAGTFSYRVVIDGVTICSGSTTDATVTRGVDLIGISIYSTTAGSWVTFSLDQVPFNSSMSIDVKHSAGETDKRTVYANYRVV